MSYRPSTRPRLTLMADHGCFTWTISPVITDERAAEDAAVEIIWRSATGSCPVWQRAADERTRLEVLTVIRVLETDRARPQPA